MPNTNNELMDCGEVSHEHGHYQLLTLSSHLCWLSISQLQDPTASSITISMQVTIHRACKLHREMFRVYVSGNTSSIEPRLKKMTSMQT